MSDMYGAEDPLKKKKKTFLGGLGETLLGIGKGAAGIVSGNPLAPLGMAADAINTVADFVPNAAERRNNQQVKSLQGREKSGQLGLGGEGKERLQNELMSPVRGAETQAANLYSSVGAQGQGGAAEMSRIRRDMGKTISGAAQGASDRVYQVDKAEAESNKQELEQRVAGQAASAEDARASVTGRIGDFLGAGSEVAGAAPLNIMGPFGTPLKDLGEARRAMDGIGIAKDMQDQVLAASKKNPNLIAELYRRKQQQQGGAGGAADQALAQVTKDWMNNV